MTISLAKGGNISLTKAAPGLQRALVGLGWNPRSTDGAPFDLDASCLALDVNGHARSERDFIFYNNQVGADGAIQHIGDNRDGVGDGDDEQILLNLSAMPAEVARIVFVASIFEADTYRLNFGQVSDAYIRVIDADRPEDSSRETRFDLGEDAATETALVFGELYRHNGEWKFRAIGQGYTSGLGGVLADFGLSAS